MEGFDQGNVVAAGRPPHQADGPGADALQAGAVLGNGGACAHDSGAFLRARQTGRSASGKGQRPGGCDGLASARIGDAYPIALADASAYLDITQLANLTGGNGLVGAAYL